MVLPPGMVPYSGWNPYQVNPSSKPLSRFCRILHCYSFCK
jgi:hypothetical protein